MTGFIAFAWNHFPRTRLLCSVFQLPTNMIVDSHQHFVRLARHPEVEGFREAQRSRVWEPEGK